MWIIFEFKAVPESVFGIWWEDAAFERVRGCLLHDEEMSSMEVALKVVGISELVCKLGLSEQVEPHTFEDSELSGLEGLTGNVQYAENKENTHRQTEKWPLLAGLLIWVLRVSERVLWLWSWV